MSPLRARVPAVAVVDSRNVRGQIGDLFGVGREVDVDGVIEMLTDYGFDVTDVFVGLASEGDMKRGSVKLRDSLRRNQAFAERIVSNARGHVLEGRLVERSGPSGKVMEEKLVDVLCAMQIARTAHEISAGKRQGVIVVLSEDMDLIPAYEFARDLQVKVYAASNERVDTRSEHSGWLLFSEGSLAQAAGQLPGNKKGTALRRSMVGILEADAGAKLRVKVGTHDGRTGRVTARHNSGFSVEWYEPKGSAVLSRGVPVEVHAHGCLQHPGPFPQMIVGRDAPEEWPGPTLERGEVIEHRTPTRISVRLDDGSTRSLDVPAGTLLPGMKVLVQESQVDGQTAWRYIGPCGKRPESPGWVDSSRPVLVRATSSASSAGARVRAVVFGSDQIVTLQPPAAERVAAGQVFAALPTAHVATGDGIHVVAMAVSSRLG